MDTIKLATITNWDAIGITSAKCEYSVTFVFVFALALTGCMSSNNPTSEELIKTKVPTFSGQQNINLTSASSLYILNGECDTISKGLEWSYNNSTWTTIAGGCPSGTFSISVVVSGIINVYVRALTKMGQTVPGIANIRFVLPPTSPAFQLVTAGTGTDLFPGFQNMDFTMSGTSTGEQGLSATYQLDSHITGIVYGP